MQNLKPNRERSVAAVAAFTVMIHAAEKGDSKTVAEMRRKLAELGVAVQIRWG